MFNVYRYNKRKSVKAFGYYADFMNGDDWRLAFEGAINYVRRRSYKEKDPDVSYWLHGHVKLADGNVYRVSCTYDMETDEFRVFASDNNPVYGPDVDNVKFIL